MTATPHVYKAIAAVTKTMAAEGIGKTRKNQQQGYSFRGIDEVLNALSPVLADASLCMLPRVLSRECTERATKSGSPLFYAVVEVEFDLVSAVDGSRHTIKTFGEAMDSADKATNKAMSAAFKYAAFQAFCIPTEGDNDADATTHDVAPSRAGKAAPKPAAPAGVDWIAEGKALAVLARGVASPDELQELVRTERFKALFERAPDNIRARMDAVLVEVENHLTGDRSAA